MRAQEFLTEYRRDRTLEKWYTKLLDRVVKDQHLTANTEAYRDSWRSMKAQISGQQADRESLHQLAMFEIETVDSAMQQLELADPTKNKQYTQWLVKQYVSGAESLEDITSTVADALEVFHKGKTKNLLSKDQRDINRLSAADVERIANMIKQEVDANEGNKTEKQNAKIVYEDDQVRIIVPQDQEAACYYGQGTRWCTAAKNNNMFDYYNQTGPLYILLPKKPEYPGEKYQAQMSSADKPQLMNQADQSVDPWFLLHRRFSSKVADVLIPDNKKQSIINFSEDEIVDVVNDMIEHPYVEARAKTNGWAEEYQQIVKTVKEIPDTIKNVITESNSYGWSIIPHAILEALLVSDQKLYDSVAVFDFVNSLMRLRINVDDNKNIEIIAPRERNES